MQIPHHGSKHNISKGILKNIWAPNAIISCALSGDPHHPSKIVTNALHRREITPFCTKGFSLYYKGGMAPSRYGIGNANPFPFQSYVEVSD
jgi:hypothetical protein